MTNKTRNEFAFYGLAILKHAVLLVLYEADGEPLKVGDIRKDLGIPRKYGSSGTVNDLIQAVLGYLVDDGKYVELVDRGTWRITKEGVEFLEEEKPI